MAEELERVYTVPLRGVYQGTHVHVRRAVRSMKLLKAFISRHMKAAVESVKISAGLNDAIWARGMQKPPRKVKIIAKKSSDGIVLARLVGEETPNKKEATKKEEKKPSAPAPAPAKKEESDKKEEPKQEKKEQKKSEKKEQKKDSKKK